MARADRTYRRVNRMFAVLFRLMGYRFDVRGVENVPREGAAVLAGNHIGFLDFTFIGYAARERGRFVRFMAKESVFELPVVGGLMRRMRHVPVNRRLGARAYRNARRLLEDGELVGLFPEATISRSWLLRPFKRGVGGLAVYADVPVVPVVVWGGHRIYTVDGHRSLRRRIPITVSLGTPLSARDGETADAFTLRLRDSMVVLLDDAIDAYPVQPRDEADCWWLPHDRGGSAPDPQTAARLDAEAVARIGDSLD